MTANSWPTWGTTVTVRTLDPAALPSASRLVQRCLRAAEKVADGEHPRSEVSRLARAGGRPVALSALLADLLQAAVDGAEVSDGLCDPTIGNATGAAHPWSTGAVPACGASPATAARPPVRGWRSLRVDGRRLLLPACTQLDLSATAKAYLAAGAAAHAAQQCGTGVLVEIGGAACAQGPAPSGGWQLPAPRDGSRRPQPGTLGGPGLRSGQAAVTSHGRGVLDPRTAAPVVPFWRSVTVVETGIVETGTVETSTVETGTGGTGTVEAAAVEAAALAVAAHVLGPDAVPWLAERGVTGRLVPRAGAVVELDGLRQLASA